MRPILVGFLLIACVGSARADNEPYASEEGKFSVNFPGKPKPNSNTARTKVGNVKVNVLTYANSDGSAYMMSYADFPDTATKPDNLDTLFEGIRDGVKGKDGKVTGEEKSIKFGREKLPGREFTVEKDKGKQHVRYRVVVRGSRVYQMAAIGSSDFVSGKDATAFFESFQLTK